MAKENKKTDSTIALNKRARHEYHIDERYEAGISLQGWEVKSLRASTHQHQRSVRDHPQRRDIPVRRIDPAAAVGVHVRIIAEDRRTRKLLLNRAEIDKLVGAVERKGYTIVPIAMYWKHNRVKVELGLAKGKQDHDKRAAEKERDWNREKQQTMRAKNRLTPSLNGARGDACTPGGRAPILNRNQ